MNIYVESNFLLEICLEQEEAATCEEIFGHSISPSAGLFIPAFSILEPYETIERRKRRRRDIYQSVEKELREIGRGATHHPEAAFLIDRLALLTNASEDELVRLESWRTRIQRSAIVLPLTTVTLVRALEYQDSHGLAALDAVVYASVILHLEEFRPDVACFVTRDHDFGDDRIKTELEALNCRLLFRFEDAAGFVRANT